MEWEELLSVSFHVPGAFESNGVFSSFFSVIGHFFINLKKKSAPILLKIS